MLRSLAGKQRVASSQFARKLISPPVATWEMQDKSDSSTVKLPCQADQPVVTTSTSYFPHSVAHSALAAAQSLLKYRVCCKGNQSLHTSLYSQAATSTLHLQSHPSSGIATLASPAQPTRGSSAFIFCQVAASSNFLAGIGAGACATGGHMWLPHVRPFSASQKPAKIKMKCPSSFKERFKRLATGEFKRWKAGKRHNASTKTKKQRRQLRRPAIVASGTARVLRKYAFGR